jgi:hypothetical protein
MNCSFSRAAAGFAALALSAVVAGQSAPTSAAPAANPDRLQVKCSIAGAAADGTAVRTDDETTLVDHSQYVYIGGYDYEKVPDGFNTLGGPAAIPTTDRSPNLVLGSDATYNGVVVAPGVKVDRGTTGTGPLFVMADIRYSTSTTDYLNSLSRSEYIAARSKLSELGFQDLKRVLVPYRALRNGPFVKSISFPEIVNGVAQVSTLRLTCRR